MKKVKKLIQLVWLWIGRKINHLRVKPYSDWSELPAKQFFKILENNDLRHILKKYVINYDQSLLLDAYERIMHQYEEGMNDKSYSTHLRVVKNNILKENEIHGLIICLELFKIDPKEAKKQIAKYGIKLKSKGLFENLRELKSVISGKQTNYKIHSLIDKEDNNKPVSFEETLVNFEGVGVLKTDGSEMTLKKWVFYYKKYKQKIKPKKKDGRTA